MFVITKFDCIFLRSRRFDYFKITICIRDLDFTVAKKYDEYFRPHLTTFEARSIYVAVAKLG